MSWANIWISDNSYRFKEYILSFYSVWDRFVQSIQTTFSTSIIFSIISMKSLPNLNHLFHHIRCSMTKMCTHAYSKKWWQLQKFAKGSPSTNMLTDLNKYIWSIIEDVQYLDFQEFSSKSLRGDTIDFCTTCNQVWGPTLIWVSSSSTPTVSM